MFYGKIRWFKSDTPMQKKQTLSQINNKAIRLLNCYNTTMVEQLLKLNNFELAQNTLLPTYYYFKIRKSKGGFREIEAPMASLKKIQRRLNDYLQCIYFNKQTKAAYGFVINTRKQHRKLTSKNIVSNAQNHLNKKYLLNIDFDDFFHQISYNDVFNIFKKPPFLFRKNMANTLAKICTNKGRLPMGAPTSPVLSNFACIELDTALEQWSAKNNITYTRFVDDLSFSANHKITQQHFLQIQQITNKYQFKLNQTKTKWYGINDTKIVTGLWVKDTIELPNDYLIELDKDLNRLQKTIEVQIITGNIDRPTASKKFKQEVMGKINFIAVVKGYDSQQYEKYMIKYENAINPPNKNQLSLRWMNFNNYSNL